MFVAVSCCSMIGRSTAFARNVFFDAQTPRVTANAHSVAVRHTQPRAHPHLQQIIQAFRASVHFVSLFVSRLSLPMCTSASVTLDCTSVPHLHVVSLRANAKESEKQQRGVAIVKETCDPPSGGCAGGRTGPGRGTPGLLASML